MRRLRNGRTEVLPGTSARQPGLPLVLLVVLLVVELATAAAPAATAEVPALSLIPPAARLVGPGSGLELIWTIDNHLDTTCSATLEIAASRPWRLSRTLRGIEVPPNASVRFLMPYGVPDTAAAGVVSVHARVRRDDDSTILDSCVTEVTVMNAPPAGVPVVLVSDLVRVEWNTRLRRGDWGIVEVQRDGRGWAPSGAATADEGGRCAFEDRRVTPGSTVEYRFRSTSNQLTMVSAVTTVRVPERTPLSFAGLRPNPSRAEPVVAFTLAERAATRLDVYDVAGRRVLSRDLGVLAPGPHVLSLGAQGSLRSGLYLFRLTSGGHSVSGRGVIAP